KTITIDEIPPLEFFGVNERKLKTIAKYFPKLKLVARGHVLKLIGDEDSAKEFQVRFNQFVGHYNKFGSLPILEIERLLLSDSGESGKTDDSVLVYGPTGNLVRARTPNQKKIVEATEKNDMVFVIGPAGSGKTYTAVALAVRALKKREVKRIILTRPAVEAGESIGFLPGDMKEKLDPYLQPLYDALMDMLPPVKLAQYIETGVIQIAPLGFMRGRTLDHAFVILDEAQNATEAQTRMFLTRMGNSAKFIITGDVTQVDLPKKLQSGLRTAWNMLSGVKGISFIELGGSDIVRHPLVKRIVDIYAKSDEK
ncbi:MAG: phosphate starvation-inducible PhoH-like protein, partial [Bacteroidia bacterium]